MKKLFIILTILFASITSVFAQDIQKIEVYCEVMCVQYNLFKGDVNALIDFGVADTAKKQTGGFITVKQIRRCHLRHQ